MAAVSSPPMQRKLYAHEPRTLLPLLRAYMPFSISIVSTIVANPSANDHSPDPNCPVLAPVYATFPPLAGGGDLTRESLAVAGIGEYDWLVAVSLPAPSVQLRIHHNLVSAPTEVQTPDAIAAARDVYREAMRQMFTLFPTHLKVGSVHEMFLDAAISVAGGPRRPPVWMYVAPNMGAGPTVVDVSEVPPYEDKLVLGSGNPADATLIHSTNPYRSAEYYAARSAYTTSLRPRTPDGSYSEPAAWVMTHGDGSLGALWTQPDYRRRGLAKAIVASHLAEDEARGVPGHCHVEDGNVASMRLWEGLGWTRLSFTSFWVYEE